MTRLPLVDLKWQHKEIEAEVEDGLRELFARTAFILGPYVADFEAAYAKFSNVPHVIGVGSGTDALELGIRALDIGQGDEVILPANTFIATALAVTRSGATPVLVDCDPIYQLIDPKAIEVALTHKTRAIIPVHLFGHMAPMAPILSLANSRELLVIEDAAQSHGATQSGNAAATQSQMAATSFYPGKNLGAYGDAGAVITKSASLAARVRKLRNYGSDTKGHHPEQGFNSRLDAIQAVVLSAKLKRLAHWNDLRRNAASTYSELLAEVDGIRLPRTSPENCPVWHLYVIRVKDRDSVLAGLHQRGIAAGIHYPVPVHLLGAFAELNRPQGSFPHAESAAKEVLSLPLFPGITVTEQERVVGALCDVLMEKDK